MLAFFKRLGRAFKESRGVSAILVILFLPVIFAGIHYLTQYIRKSDVHTTNTGIPYTIGKAIARAFNPGKTFSEQKKYLYSIAAQVYNDGAYIAGKEMALAHEKTIKIGVQSKSQSVASLCGFYADYCTYGRTLNDIKFSSDNEMLVNYQPFADFVYDENNQEFSFLKSDTGGVGDIVDTINEYKEDTNKLELSFNNEGNIEAKCHGLGQKAEIVMPRNDVDIIIAIPTNRASNTITNSNTDSFGDYSTKSVSKDTPIRQIAGACQLFLKNFLHTAGIAVGIIPYSGKVSLSPYFKNIDSSTTKITRNVNAPNLPYAIQAMFYGSDGKYGGDIIIHGSGDTSELYGDYKDWGTTDIGMPIMARRGQEQNYRNMVFYSGALTNSTEYASLLLDMTTPPSQGDEYKFMQMNTNPCYLGFCNTLSMTCEKDCPTYMANPYFMVELTSDIQSLIYDLEMFVPFKDERNKSNFLFLPIVMAGNLFSWGDHPSEWTSDDRVKESSREFKKRVVIVIANAPDNFEPQEITYLGFNNDYSEIPMIESDTILFNNDRGYQLDENGNYMGVKGAVRFSTPDGRLDDKGWLFKATSEDQVMTARISFPHKGLLKIVAERENPATVTIYDDNGVEDNVGTHTFMVNKTFTFRGPQQVYNWADLSEGFSSGNYTTKGPNFGHNTSTKKVKLKFKGCKLSTATLTNQTLRFYGIYSAENGKSLIGDRMDPCISFGSGASESDGWVDSGSYIKAYGFSPNCSGVSSLGKFIMAASRFSDSDIIDDSTVGSGKGVKYSDSSGTKYRVYTGGSLPFYTGKLNIYSYYYYDLFASKKHRERTITQTLTATRNYPETAYNSRGEVANNNNCCSIVWKTYRIPTIVSSSCNTTSHTMLSGGTSTYDVSSCSSCSSVSYQTNCTVSDRICSATNTKTGQTYSYVCGKQENCSNATASSSCSSYDCPYQCNPHDCNCRDVDNSVWAGGNIASCGSTAECTGSDRYICDCSSSDCRGICNGKASGCVCVVKIMSRTKRVCDTCYDTCPKTCYSCTRPNTYTQTNFYTGCQTATWEEEHEEQGYNNSVGCTVGSCGSDSTPIPVYDAEDWTLVSKSRSVSCSERWPTTTVKQTYRQTQQQDSTSCNYSEGATYNSSCSYPGVSDPSLSYSSGDAYCGQTGGGVSSSRSVSSWTETQTEQKRFYGYYPRTIDGEYASIQYYVCDTSGGSCSSSSCAGTCNLKNVGTRDDSKTKILPYRYLLHNFFFVNGDTKSTTYEYTGGYPDYTLSSSISSESDSSLVSNQGIYLLPTGETGEYWVCFCGDAMLQLDFTDATDASIAFSNIYPIRYGVSLGDSATRTVGIEGNDIVTRETFYIHPDQIKDILDENGNYYVDLTIKGQPRILSVELTNRPLEKEDLTAIDNGEIVGQNSLGGKIVGDADTTIELKLPEETAYVFTAQPISFWIDGQSDFRQTSGTVRVCSNTNETTGIINAKVPDEGSGKIALTVKHPTATHELSVTGEFKEVFSGGYPSEYTIVSDRKLKSISIPSFVRPVFSYGFGTDLSESKPLCEEEIDKKVLFDWSLNNFSHFAVDNGSGFSNKTCPGAAHVLNFSLRACKLVEAKAKNLIMKFSPTENDFPNVVVSNKYNDTLSQRLGTCNESLSFVPNNGYPTVCGDLDGSGKGDCQQGYWFPESRCYDSGYYVSVIKPLQGWETETTVDMKSAFNMYGPGTIRLFANRRKKSVGVTMFAGESNNYYGTTGNECERGENTSTWMHLSGACNSEDKAIAGIKETTERELCAGNNYLSACYYQVTDPCDLTTSDHLSYSERDEVKHDYEGKIEWHGIADIQVYVEPQKIRSDSFYERDVDDLSDVELSGSFGNYKYTFSEPDYLLNLDDEELTKSKGSFQLLYSTGKIGTATINAESYINYSVQATSSIDNYYYTDIDAENVLVTVSTSVISKIDDEILNVSQQGIPQEKTFTVSPYTHTFEKRSDGYYYVKLKCRNVYISNLKSVANFRIYYAHPNIIHEGLINTRIIDGYDQASYQQMMLYGNMNCNNTELPSVSAVQKLFYNIKSDNTERYFYPRSEGAGAALDGEEGDFFIQIWDHNSEAPAVRWKIGNAIQSNKNDITISGSGFGGFKSDYAFNGLHRMFFPYNIYNKDYAGYSYAYNSALVFAGFTLPINLILTNNGYQTTYSLSSGNVSNYTRPKEALTNLANDACKRLKADLANEQGNPIVLLVKYRTDALLSLEDCADETYSASSEEELNVKLNDIAHAIKQNRQSLKIKVSDVASEGSQEQPNGL